MACKIAFLTQAHALHPYHQMNDDINKNAWNRASKICISLLAFFSRYRGPLNILVLTQVRLKSSVQHLRPVHLLLPADTIKALLGKSEIDLRKIANALGFRGFYGLQMYKGLLHGVSNCENFSFVSLPCNNAASMLMPFAMWR